MEPEFYDDLVYKFKKIDGSNIFSALFIKIISHYKLIGETLIYCDKLNAWWSTHSRLTKIVSEYYQEKHNQKLQTNPWHSEEEPNNNHETPGSQTKQSKQLSLSPIKVIAKLEWT